MKTLLCFLLSALCLSAHGQAVLRSAFLQSFSQTASAPASYVLKDSYETDADYNTTGGTGNDLWGAMSFTAGSSYTLARLAIKCKYYGTATNYALTFRVHADSAGSPATTALATSTTSKTQGDLPASEDWVTFDFVGVALTSGTKYHIVFTQDTADSASGFRFRTGTWGAVSGQQISCGPDGSDWNVISASTQGDFRTYALE